MTIITTFAAKEYSNIGKWTNQAYTRPRISYLKQAHVYFLDYVLPMIRRRLIEAIDCSGSDEVAFLILRFYDEYVVEVRRHMEYENRKVFRYVEDYIFVPAVRKIEISDSLKETTADDQKADYSLMWSLGRR